MQWADMVVPLCSALVSVMTFLAMRRQLTSKVEQDYVSVLEARLTLCEKDVKECHEAKETNRQQINNLREENLWLINKIRTLEEKNK